ncbi:PLP-dependent aminotransferase family protein [Streptomyces naphthomycinicus]|uniref:aminotransferase-like domain-containing protein n=1 Tax=Streptomyces naphthomycinicus TaxID=2872625 RepID=UPI001CEDA961|nr:PLP-dependent aminotransferase family protein [Streptomyces sp. TML10]
MDDYRRIADRIAADITGGRLLPGQRLPPQRAFARRHGIAPSTAGRVYSELVRRGLVVGEVGRGTFVRAGAPDGQPGHALAEPAGAPPVNLELNYPSAPGQSELLAPALAPLLRPDALGQALRPAAAAGTPAARAAVAALLARSGLRAGPDRVLFTGNARQAIAACLAALVRPGGRVGVEPLTYPLVKEIAVRLGLHLVPLATDAEGVVPRAVAAAHRGAPLSALYLQPALHNPTSHTTSAGRLRQLADCVHSLGIPVVEDRIWSFLHLGGTPPLAALAPELVHLVDGLSKRVAPGLTVGFAVVPEDRVEAVARAVRSGGWSAGGFALEAAVRWLGDGTVDRLVAAKRQDARRRQRLVAEKLAGFAVRSDPAAYFAWWELPRPWRADTFTAAARAHGIAVTPGTAFSVDPGRTPDAVRLGLASVPEPQLARALATLAALARDGAGAAGG